VEAETFGVALSNLFVETDVCSSHSSGVIASPAGQGTEVPCVGVDNGYGASSSHVVVRGTDSATRVRLLADLVEVGCKVDDVRIE